jgi:quercetin dioxygenase-like cupin family protein
MKSKWILVLLLVVVGAAVYGGAVLATPPAPGLTATILGKGTFAHLNLRARSHSPRWRAHIRTHGLSDLYVVDNKFAPNADTGWHSHPGPSLIIVLSGTVTNYLGDDPSCTPHVYSAGSTFVDEGGTDVHILRNESGAQAETLAVQLIPSTAGRRIDMPAPGNCPF